MTDKTQPAEAPAPAAPKPTTLPLGSVVTVKDGAKVTPPAGATVKVAGTAYVLDAPGIHVIDGREVVAE